MGLNLSNITKFLSELSHNNNKEWFDQNRKTYEQCRADFLVLLQELIDGIAQFDESLTGVDPKKCIFRINRDIRFSKDKTPYKTNFGALLGAQGRKTEGAGYYIHIASGHNFIGGGMYKPQPEMLAKVRQEIDYNSQDLIKILERPTFKKMFGKVQGEQLKTAPKGYPKDHPFIELLRYKSFYVLKEFEDADFEDKSFKDSVLSTYKEAHIFNDFLENAIS